MLSVDGLNVVIVLLKSSFFIINIGFRFDRAVLEGGYAHYLLSSRR